MERRSLILCALLTVGATAPRVAAAGHRPKAGTELTGADLAWPATTRSVRTRVAATVYRRAGRGGGAFGKVGKGQHVAWQHIVATADRCHAWLELDPRGWVCAKDVAPSDDLPVATALPKKVKTGTAFVGLDLVASPPPSWPFAWALEPQPFHRGEKNVRRPRPTPVLASPDAKADVVRTLPPRSIVAVLETRGDFVRIGEGEWVARTQLRVANQATRPDGLADDARWIDVDLDEQVLITYQGDTPVYATLVSSGRRNGTPTGIYRIASKVVTKTMDDGGAGRGTWHHPDTPFVMHFRKRYALHAAYWHDRFGNQRSVGCVNLTPEDARWVFAWASPAIPAGWLEVEADRDEGSVVRIHSHADRHPKWIDFDGEPLRARAHR